MLLDLEYNAYPIMAMISQMVQEVSLFLTIFSVQQLRACKLRENSRMLGLVVGGQDFSFIIYGAPSSGVQCSRFPEVGALRT